MDMAQYEFALRPKLLSGVSGPVSTLKWGTNERQGTSWGLGTKRGTEVRFLRVLTGA